MQSSKEFCLFCLDLCAVFGDGLCLRDGGGDGVFTLAFCRLFSRFFLGFVILSHLLEVFINGLALLLTFLLAFVLDACLALRAALLDELPTADALVFCKPTVGGLWLPVHGALDVAVEGRLGAAEPRTTPNVLAVQVHLIVEVVEYGDVKARDLIDVAHDLLELTPVAALCQAGSGVSEEEEGMDHLVQQCLLELVGCTVLEEWGREADSAGVVAGVRTGTRAQRHLLAPLHVALVQPLLEEELVIVEEHLVDVHHFVLVLSAEVLVIHCSLQLQPLEITPNHPNEVLVCTRTRRRLSSNRPFDRLSSQFLCAELIAYRRFSKTSLHSTLLFNARWEGRSPLQSRFFFGLRAMIECVFLKSQRASCPSDSRRRAWQQSLAWCRMMFSVSFSCISDRKDSRSLVIPCNFNSSRRVCALWRLRSSSSWILSLHIDTCFQLSLRMQSNSFVKSRWRSRSSPFHSLRLASSTSTSLRVRASSRLTAAMLPSFIEITVRLSWIYASSVFTCNSRQLI